MKRGQRRSFAALRAVEGRFCIRGWKKMETMKAPTGRKLYCKGWEQEGLLRLLMNCLDGSVAENPAELVVYGATGKAARKKFFTSPP